MYTSIYEECKSLINLYESNIFSDLHQLVSLMLDVGFKLIYFEDEDLYNGEEIIEKNRVIFNGIYKENMKGVKYQSDCPLNVYKKIVSIFIDVYINNGYEQICKIFLQITFDFILSNSNYIINVDDAIYISFTPITYEQIRNSPLYRIIRMMLPCKDIIVLNYNCLQVEKMVDDKVTTINLRCNFMKELLDIMRNIEMNLICDHI